MNKVPIIRKNSYKDYLKTSIFGGFLAGLVFGLITLLGSGSLSTSLSVGAGVWVLIIIIYMAVGFPGEEYFKRKKRIARLQSSKYNFLYENDFKLHEDLFFEGTYQDYFFRISPMVKWVPKGDDIEYEVIEAYYDYDPGKIPDIKSLNGEYYPGVLTFANKTVSYLPKDWDMIDFKENLEGVVSILKREHLHPIEMKIWEKEVGEKLKSAKKEEEESRTKHLLKIGRILDIKYTKTEK
jgi:hypothetical protein